MPEPCDPGTSDTPLNDPLARYEDAGSCPEPRPMAAVSVPFVYSIAATESSAWEPETCFLGRAVAVKQHACRLALGRGIFFVGTRCLSYITLVHRRFSASEP